MNTRKVQKFGWRPQLPDHRDHQFSIEQVATLPVHVDLEPGFPAAYDQDQLGSCTGNAIAGAYEFDLKKQKKTDFMPSRLFIYYNERAMEGTIKQDAGAQIRDGIKSISKQGVCSEKTWPYVITKFARKPTKAAFAEGLKHTSVKYSAVNQTEHDMKACLAGGFPIVMGFTVYESFESEEVAQTGMLNMPQQGEQVVGGHAIVVVGYDDATKRFKVRNSWGTSWGANGYFTVPYAYFTNKNLATDLWVVSAVTG